MSDYLGIGGKTAIITGGVTKVGRYAVDSLHESGVNVVVSDIDRDGGKNAVHGKNNALFCERDITDDDAIDTCVAAVLESFGFADILVNLACTYVDDGAESSQAQWSTALDVNLVSAAMFATAVRPHMAAQGGGFHRELRLHLLESRPDRAVAVPVSKAAVVQPTRHMAMNLSRKNIRRQTWRGHRGWHGVFVRTIDQVRGLALHDLRLYRGREIEGTGAGAS